MHIAMAGLPPGFRFYPSDEKLFLYYLLPKNLGMDFPSNVIGDINLYTHDPWVLPGRYTLLAYSSWHVSFLTIGLNVAGKALLIDSEKWYFFTQRDRKYPNGSVPNRGAGSGFWKATGSDKTITSGGQKVGVRKSLVFCIGKPPNGSKIDWIMHEYRVLLDGENGSFSKNKESTSNNNRDSLQRPTRLHSEEDAEATPSFNGCMFSSIPSADQQLAGASLLERDTCYQPQEFPDTPAFELSDIDCPGPWQLSGLLP
ncbi:NAC domain-containing protein 19 [Nymphaea thermarum]|nr:NAC domain-containing protein 19 [Nymphaea thermarum]